ncbi:hypothetical protein [Burkholderia ubonensis]|uniref:hypothetical protein n=1 Tax=Burkholderia ubonensis TaxID=101571 RepID=UPI0012FBB426|nr:hypothetical protein [Burkholderia ubonensis]
MVVTPLENYALVNDISTYETRLRCPKTTARREALTAANTGRIRKERLASGRFRGNPKLEIHPRRMPEFAYMAMALLAPFPASDFWHSHLRS